MSDSTAPDLRWVCPHQHGPFPVDFEPNHCPECGLPLHRVIGTFRLHGSEGAEDA
jgi:hypothetical protein